MHVNFGLILVIEVCLHSYETAHKRRMAAHAKFDLVGLVQLVG